MKLTEPSLSAADLETHIGSLFDDPDFISIERRISPLNLFEAVGAIRSELRHSNFLAYLLSPSRPHGLGSKPLVAILRSILSRLPPSERPVMTFELIAGELDDAIIYREHANIDILVELPSLDLAVVIENKVDAKASDGQLERYREYLQREFSNYRRLLVFLTPDGDDPGHDDYLAYSYGDLVATLERLIDGSAEAIPDATRLVVKHYIEMVRRHIVQDDDLRTLAQALYERHKEAFDFIFKWRPDPLSLLTVLREAAQGAQELIEDRAGSNEFMFVPEVWDQKLKAIKGDSTKWSKTGRGLLFVCKTYPSVPGRVNISLVLGPGDQAIRAQVYERATAQPDLFTGLVKPMGRQWVTIFSRDLLTSAQAQGLSFEMQSSKISSAWSDFQATQLPALVHGVLEIDERLHKELER